MQFASQPRVPLSTHVYTHPLLCSTLYSVCLYSTLHFHYVFMPDVARCLEFMTHKWGSWAHVPVLLSVDTEPVLFPVIKPLGEQGRKVTCMKRARLFLESKWEVPSDPGKRRELEGGSSLAGLLGRESCLARGRHSEGF